MLTPEEARTAHIGPGMYPMLDLWKDVAPPKKFVGSRFAKRAHEASKRGATNALQGASPRSDEHGRPGQANVHFVYESDRRAANAVQIPQRRHGSSSESATAVSSAQLGVCEKAVDG